MEGPVLSGGVIVLVAALLWLLYLLPSWRGRYQFDAAERNALRLNRALRVMAETSENPGEVQLELNTRTALAQQRLAKRLQAEREAAQLAQLRAELAVAKSDPVLRQARARRRVRLSATAMLCIGLLLAGLGTWQMLLNGNAAMLWGGGILAVLAASVLQRMAAVAARAARAARRAAVVEAPALRVAPQLHDQGPAVGWTPRALPEPMVSKAGSRAHAAQSAADAQKARRDAARAAALREQAERMAPPAPTTLPAPSKFAQMGYVDDAEIEAHVRKLLAKRATG